MLGVVGSSQHGFNAVVSNQDWPMVSQHKAVFAAAPTHPLPLVWKNTFSHVQQGAFHSIYHSSFLFPGFKRNGERWVRALKMGREAGRKPSTCIPSHLLRLHQLASGCISWLNIDHLVSPSLLVSELAVVSTISILCTSIFH